MALLSISSQLQFILIQTILHNLTMVKDFPMKRCIFFYTPISSCMLFSIVFA